MQYRKIATCYAYEKRRIVKIASSTLVCNNTCCFITAVTLKSAIPSCLNFVMKRINFQPSKYLGGLKRAIYNICPNGESIFCSHGLLSIYYIFRYEQV